MKLSVSAALFLALSGASTMAFVPQSIQRTAASTSLNMAAEGSDRRSFVGQVRLACLALLPLGFGCASITYLQTDPRGCHKCVGRAIGDSILVSGTQARFENIMFLVITFSSPLRVPPPIHPNIRPHLLPPPRPSRLPPAVRPPPPRPLPPRCGSRSRSPSRTPSTTLISTGKEWACMRNRSRMGKSDGHRNVPPLP